MDKIKRGRTRQVAKWFGQGIVVLIILILLWLNRYHLSALLDFLRDREAIAAYLDPFGIWGPLLYLLILGVQVITAVIPGHALLITAGYLYGFGGGLTLNIIGVIVVSQLVFVMTRQAGKPFAQRFVPLNILERWDEIARRQGFLFFLICFWFPIIPSNVTNYIAGLSAISFWLFLLANFLGRMPGLVLVTLIGSHGLELSWEQWLVILPVALVVIVGGRYLTAKIERRFNPQ